MFEHAEFSLAMTIFAIAGIALMADEKIESICVMVMEWMRKRGRR
jgi:hypothetical protein